jgi:hypothetical protein
LSPEPAGYPGDVTIPDLGHCVGSGTPPAEGTLENRDGVETGVCPACAGRFPLHHTGVVSLHDAADLDEREAWAPSAD